MLFGHDDIRIALTKLADAGELQHSYLFFGDPEIGKASLARSLAHYIERGSFEISSVSLLDTAVFVPNEKGSIGIDEVRAVKRFLWQTPFGSPKRIAIVDRADELTPEAAGAMLKIVEEPPSHGLIVFVTHDPEAIPKPLASRLFKVFFKRATTDDVRKFLLSQGVSEKDAVRLATHSFGRVGRAIKMRDGEQDKGPDAVQTLEDTIVTLHREDPVRNSHTISLLLQRLDDMKRYNVNENLQKKAIEHTIRSHYN